MIQINDAFILSKNLSDLLKIKNTGLTYPISDNLSKLDEIVKTFRDEAEKIRNDHTVKDAKGKFKKFKIELIDGKPQIMFDGKGNPIPGKGPAGSSSIIDSLKADAFDSKMRELENKKHAFTPTKISKNKIEELCESEVISCIDLSGLIRFGIIK